MQAVVLKSKENFIIKEVQNPEINDDQALVKVKACGICGTDIHAYRGDFMPTFPLILGHEFTGVIKNKGKNITEFNIGDRVVASPEIYCHYCDNCRSGNEKYCSNWKSIGTNINGAFAEYISVRKDCLYMLPDSITFEVGSLVEPATCVYSAIRLISDYFGKRVVILGAGSIGLIFLNILKAKNTLEIDLIDISDFRLDIAKSMGADNIYNINTGKENYFVKIRKKYDIVIDCTGVAEVIKNGFSLLDPDSYFIFFGVSPTKSKIKISSYKVYEQSLKIIGVYPDMKSFKTIIDMMEKGILNFEKIVTHKFKLKDFMKAFNTVVNSNLERIKVVIIP